MRLRADDVARLAGAGSDNPVVWERSVSRGLVVRHFVLCQRDRDTLVAEFGQDWLEEYLAGLDADLLAWAHVGDTGRWVH